MNKLLKYATCIFILCACKSPDQVGEEDSHCTGGASVLTIDDSNVSIAIKNKIYNTISGSSIIHTGHPDYNSGGRLVLIPVSFTDAPANPRVTNDVIDQAFFNTASGSVRDYFSENSWGQFNITKAGVSNVVNLNRAKSFYSTTSEPDYTRNRNLYRDACQSSSIDWANIDRNNDRIITPNEALIALIIADGGRGAFRPNQLNIQYNGETYQIRNRFVTLDCTRSTDPAQGVETFSANYSNIWHELAHGFFGLDDLYEDGIAGTGKAGSYDIMDNNNIRLHMSIVAKMKIGWIRPKILLPAAERIPTGLKCYTISNSEAHPMAVILYHNGSPDECFIIENKSMSGSVRNFNSQLPSEGLAVWWLNTNTGALRLIDASLIARNSGLRPMEYDTPSANALFAYKDGDNPNVPIMLRNQNGQLIFSLRAISPLGQVMRVEL